MHIYVFLYILSQTLSAGQGPNVLETPETRKPDRTFQPWIQICDLRETFFSERKISDALQKLCRGGR